MELKSRAKVGGNVKLEVFKAEGLVRDTKGDIVSGELVQVIEAHNMNVNAGLNFMREGISRVSTPMGFIAAGTGSTAVTSTDTALQTEIGRVAILGYSDTTTGVIVFRAIFESPDANGNLREFGIFNASTVGTMMTRTVLGAAFTKDTSLVVRVNWTITFSDT